MLVVHTIGSASGLAAREHTSENGPDVIQHSPFSNLLAKHKLELIWEDIIHQKTIPTQCTEIANKISALTTSQKKFLTIGGDHSCAIGTWSGAASALKQQGPLGLIWIDAHMDSHTPETTPSGNIHGMPLAVLLGYGDPALTQISFSEPKILPQNLVLIGVRSFESGEAELLKKLNIKIFTMKEVLTRGLDVVMQEAIEIVSKNTVGYGISIDLDAIDPTEAPGTGAREPNGLNVQELCAALKQVQVIGAEIAEFDPHFDQEHKTEKVVFELINAIFK